MIEYSLASTYALNHNESLPDPDPEKQPKINLCMLALENQHGFLYPLLIFTNPLWSLIEIVL